MSQQPCNINKVLDRLRDFVVSFDYCSFLGIMRCYILHCELLLNF